MVTCTFAGHREVYQSKIDVKIEQTIQKLLLNDTEFIFYTGGMGDFDSKCASAVCSAKRRNPGLNIRLALVLPYMSNRLNTDKDFYKSCYDDIIIPMELCNAHYKAAITKRNRWMVDRADCLIAYIYRDFGGALETVKYAQRQGKPVINLAEEVNSHI